MADLTPITTVNAATTGGTYVDFADVEAFTTVPATVLALPPKYADLSSQVALQLRLPPPNPDGTYTLSTPAGPLVLQLAQKLAAQTAVGLVLIPNDAGLQATLLLPAYLEGTANTSLTAANLSVFSAGFGLADAVILPGNIPPTPSIPLQAGQILKAYPLGNIPLATPEAFRANAEHESAFLAGNRQELPKAIGNLSLSGRLLATIQTTLQSLQQSPATSITQQSQNQAGLKLLAGASSETLQGASVQILQWAQAGETLSSHVKPDSTIFARLSQNPTLIQNIANNILEGHVSGQTLQGQPVVTTAKGDLVLPGAKGIPNGTQLLLAIIPDDLITEAGNKWDELGDFKPGISKQWPALAASLQQLIGNDLQLDPNIANSLPKLNSQLPIAALFFWSALRTGDLRNWLGDRALDKIRASGRGADMLAKASHEFKALQESEKDSDSGEWKTYPLPFSDQNGLSVMNFYVRRYNSEPDTRENEENNKKRSNLPDARFVVEIGFSEIGNMQLDGLIRRKEGQRLLDMIIRTQIMLPIELRNTLRDGFFNVLGATGVNGTLAFQTGVNNWVKPQKHR